MPMERAIIDEQFLTEARAKLPPITGNQDEQHRRMLETAITSLLALQAIATDAALQLCTKPDDDGDFDRLTIPLKNQMWIYDHFLNVYRALRDKPDVVS